MLEALDAWCAVGSENRPGRLGRPVAHLAGPQYGPRGLDIDLKVFPFGYRAARDLWVPLCRFSAVCVGSLLAGMCIIGVHMFTRRRYVEISENGTSLW